MNYSELPVKEKTYNKLTPSQYRLIFYILGVIALGIISYNFYRNAVTVFSGTHYMSLPSNFYVIKALECNKFTDADTLKGDKIWETIPVGSFILEINGVDVNSKEEFNNALSKFKPDAVLKIRVFNIKKSEQLKDLDMKSRYAKLSDLYEIPRSQISDNSVKFLTGGILMAYIEPEGATDRAGIKSGDILLNINGKELKIMSSDAGEQLTLESLKYLRSFESGVPIYYNVLRNNEQLTLVVKLAVFGIPIEILLLLITGLPFFIMGLYLILKRPELVSSRMSGYVLLLFGFQILTAASFYPPEFDIFSYWKIFLNNLVNFAALPVVLHSLFYFPETHPSIHKFRKHIIILYIIALLEIVYFSYWYIINYTKMNQDVFNILIIVSFIYYIALMVIYRRTESKEYIKKARLIRIAWILTLSITFGPTILNYLKISSKFFNAYGFVLLTLLPFVYIYVINKYKLFDMGMKIRRNIQYIFLTYIWKGYILILFLYLLSILSKINIQFPNVNFVIFGSKIEVLSIPLDDRTNAFYNKLFFLAISVIAGLILYKIGITVINFFDRKYYRQKFDYKHAQTELVKLIGSKFTVESLAKIIIEKVSELVRLKRAGAIFFKDEKEIWGEKSYCFDSMKKNEYCFDVNEGIIDLLKQFKKPFPVEYLSRDFRKTLIDHGFKYVVTFKSKDRILGALFIGEKLSETQLNAEDIDFLESIVTSASVAVENAFLYEELTEQERYKQELQIAHRIQMASLPQRVPRVKGLDISATSLPAFEVGGDFYDFLNGEDGKVTVVVGDVSGKGTSAALYMSKIQGILQTLNEFTPSPDQLLVKANRLIYKNIDSKSFITAVGASFDTTKNELFLARAGHLPIYFLSNINNKVGKVQPSGIGIGLSGEQVFNENLEQRKIIFAPGDVFFFVSDGITDSVNKGGEQYGEERLIEFIEKNSYLSSKQMCDGIMSSVKQFSEEAKQFDDMTVVVVRAERTMNN